MSGISHKQRQIIVYLRSVKKATWEEIYENVVFSYKRNHRHFVVPMLDRMVSRKIIDKLPDGYYKINEKHKKDIK